MTAQLTDAEKSLFHSIYCGDANAVKRLIESGVNPDVEDPFHGVKPIHIAASKGMTDILQILLEDQRVSADSVDRKGKVPYEWADDFKYAEAECLIISHILGHPDRYNKQSVELARHHLNQKKTESKDQSLMRPST